ncbi:MAG: 2-phospho-L-lactate guanylyltransferase [Anaerolineales bacterium]
MALWAVVPVKPLRRGKSRLAGVLSNEERTSLNRKLLAHTIDTLVELPDLEHVLVVSRDPEALALARDRGARTVLEDGAPHLNIALTRATVIATTYAAQGILILPADLPQISAEDIHTMITAGQDPPVVVIAPDYRREGTNALLVNPAGLIQYDFGPNSFERHVAQAEAKGAEVKVLDLPSLAHDVDLPEDLTFLNGQLNLWTSGEEDKDEGYRGYYRELAAEDEEQG